MADLPAGVDSRAHGVLEEIVPEGAIDVVDRPDAEIGKALATSKRIARIAFTGETVTGRQGAAAQGRVSTRGGGVILPTA
jgi:acyl-CoA reductase-like NAD-dependent aldehyde dehydrogenase